MFNKSKLMEEIRDYCLMVDNKDILHRNSCEFFDRLYGRLKEAGYEVTLSKSIVSTKYYTQSLEYLNDFILKGDMLTIKTLLHILKDLGVDVSVDLNVGVRYEDIVENIKEMSSSIKKTCSIPKEVGEMLVKENQKMIESYKNLFKPIIPNINNMTPIEIQKELEEKMIEPYKKLLKPIIPNVDNMSAVKIQKVLEEKIKEIEQEEQSRLNGGVVVGRTWDTPDTFVGNPVFKISETPLYKELKQITKEVRAFEMTPIINIQGDNNQVAVGNGNKQIQKSTIEEGKANLKDLIDRLEKIEGVNSLLIEDLRVVEQNITENNTEEEIANFKSILNWAKNKLKYLPDGVALVSNLVTIYTCFFG